LKVLVSVVRDRALDTTFRPPYDRNDKLPFIGRRGEVAHISIGRWIRWVLLYF